MTAKTKSPRRRGGRGDELVFMALGGLGEIGMNVYLYGLGAPDDRAWLMVDLGLTFPGDAEPGVDVVLPDLRFIEAAKSQLAGIVITHAHEDHIGAVIDLWPSLGAPIYATRFTAGMLRSKIAENGGRVKPKIIEIEPGGRFEVGPFDVELINMSHSIPETSGLAIRTRHGLVIHSADWKLDPAPLVGGQTDEAKLKRLGEEGVLALVCDSTNAMREGRSPSETEVAHSLARIIKGARRRVAVTTFASNVARVRAVADAAQATGRELVVVGRALHRIIEVAIDTGYLPPGFRYREQDQFGFVEPDKLLALVTGSQGEARAAMSRMAEGEHPFAKLDAGDMVIFSSRTIPGNERAVLKVQNGLAAMGCEVITDADGLVHVTGHPRRDELRQIYAWLKPQIAVPMHGEARHLREHAKLATLAGAGSVEMVMNGQMLRLAPDGARIVDEAPTGRLYRDGKLIVPSGEGPVRERRKLSFVGLAAVAFALDRKGALLGEIEVALDGIPYLTGEGEDMEDVALDAVEGTLKSIPAQRRRDVELVRDAVRRAVRGAIEREWGKRPIVKVLIVEPDA